MKIAIGMKIKDGPFGGGNQFGKTLSAYLTSKGHQVFFDLKQSDLDIILLTDPRPYLQSVAFGPTEVMRYTNKVNPKSLLIQRINECDERKGTKTLNKQLALTNSIVDHTIYIASWLEDLFKKQGLTFTKNFSIIKNGADPSIFIFEEKRLAPGKKIKLVTHHWAANWMKGWDIYSLLDQLLGTEEYGSKFEFHFIGNAPKDIKLQHTICHPPCCDHELAALLKTCDIYLTASINEPAGMHHIEGALCGLPILYRNSGGLPEYCNGYGVSFSDKNDFALALDKLVSSYDDYAKKMAYYDNTSEKMCYEYLCLFKHLLENHDSIIHDRGSKKSKLLNELSTKLKIEWYHLLSKLNDR